MSCRAAVVGFATVFLSAVLAADPPTRSDTAPGARIGGSSRDGHLAVRETVLARFDAEANCDTLLVDRGTARRVLWISGRDRAQRLVADGSPGPVFQEIPFTRGERIGPFHGVLSERGSPNVALDGSRVAYVAKRDKKWFVTVDGKEYGPYGQYYAPWLRRWRAALSWDGSSIAAPIGGLPSGRRGSQPHRSLLPALWEWGPQSTGRRLLSATTSVRWTRASDSAKNCASS